MLYCSKSCRAFAGISLTSSVNQAGFSFSGSVSLGVISVLLFTAAIVKDAVQYKRLRRRGMFKHVKGPSNHRDRPRLPKIHSKVPEGVHHDQESGVRSCNTIGPLLLRHASCRNDKCVPYVLFHGTVNLRSVTHYRHGCLHEEGFPHRYSVTPRVRNDGPPFTLLGAELMQGMPTWVPGKILSVSVSKFSWNEECGFSSNDGRGQRVHPLSRLRSLRFLVHKRLRSDNQSPRAREGLSGRRVYF